MENQCTPEDEKFSLECKAILKEKHKEGIEAYAPVLTQYMRQCQEEFQNKTYSPRSFAKRWQSLFQAAKGFDPRIRCYTESEFKHFPALLILKQQGKKEEYAYYMLRFRIDDASGTDQEKSLLIQEIERKKHEQQQKQQASSDE